MNQQAQQYYESTVRAVKCLQVGIQAAKLSIKMEQTNIFMAVSLCVTPYHFQTFSHALPLLNCHRRHETSVIPYRNFCLEECKVLKDKMA